MQNYAGDRRYFFLAVNTGYVTGSLPDSRCREFYAARSGNDLHCAIVGNVVIPKGLGSNDFCAEISDAPAWRQLAEVIGEKGAVAGIQLSTTWQGYKGMKRFVPYAEEDPLSVYKSLGASISQQQARLVFDGLYRGTELAVKAGFRHIQLHAAHGYLFNLLLDHRLSNHADLAYRSIQRWVGECATSKVESSIRLSLWAGHPELDQHQATRITDDLVSLSADFFDISAGFYNLNKRLIYPSTLELLADRTAGTLNLAQRHPDRNFILSGRSAGAWDESLPPNVHIGICRDLIANPNFLKDRSEGCSLCMKCHYFSRGTEYLDCGKWV